MKNLQCSLRRSSMPLRVLTVLLLAILLAGCAGAEPLDVAEAEPAATPLPQEEATAEPASEAAAESAAAPAADVPVAELTPAERNQYYSAPPAMAIDPATYYYATLVTERGDIRVQLFADRAAETVNNFVFLANEGFYDNTSFHRVIDGFMAQAGDPTGTGTGGPGYQFGDEIVPGLVFDRPGLLAMANAGPGTNGSQFFITFAPTDWLNGLHTIFGEVIEGEEVLNEITRRDPIQDADTPGDLIETIIIEESSESVLPTPTPPPPTPTPFPPSSMENAERPLAALDPAERANYFNTEPEMTIDPAQQYMASVVTTQGDFVIELVADKAPIAVNNFVTLANLGFYDGLPVNQIVPEQVVIIGSPDNNPANDAGYQFDAELDIDVVPARGSVAYIPVQSDPMQQALRASSSQLLIALAAPPMESNAAFSFFGQVVEGDEVLDLLSETDTIESITVTVQE